MQRVLGTQSRATIFRILSAVGYLTSYSHAGRYYTLEEIPRFDCHGLWAHGEILFSRDRTLRATIVRLVNEAPAGQTYAELQDKLRLRVHDTLLDLVRDGEVRRSELDWLYLYVSGELRRARRQTAERRRLLEEPPKALVALNKSMTIEVLLAFIQHPRADVVTLASLLQHAGKAVSRADVEAVFARYELGKKKRPRGAGRAER
ncbi:MAG: hypothetical protein AB1486_11565 [Planctomycetota bacterium]